MLSFVWLWNLLQLKPDIERYEALVYHMSYRALPVENKIDNGFLAYVVDLFCDKLDSIPDEGRYTALSLCIQMELYPSALLLTEKGADLHDSGYDHEVLPRSNNHRHTMTSQFLHTIASRSLLTSARFIKWREPLVKAGMNVAKFAKAAAQENPLVDGGWSERALGEVFQLDIKGPRENLCRNMIQTRIVVVILVVAVGIWLRSLGWRLSGSGRTRTSPQWRTREMLSGFV